MMLHPRSVWKVGLLLCVLGLGAAGARAQQCAVSRPCSPGHLCQDGQCVPVEDAVAAPGGRVFWVAAEDPAARDDNPGTADRPWKTIGRATGPDVLAPGDAVVVRAGVYREAVRPEAGGTGPDRRVTYAAYPGEAVVVSGAVPLDGGWTRRSDGAWRHAWTHELRAYGDGVFRRELVVADGRVLRPVYARGDLEPGTFFVQGSDTAPEALYVRLPDDGDPNAHAMEAGLEPSLFWPRANPYTQCGDADQPGWLRVVGFTFRHAANRAQHGAVCVGNVGGLFEENRVEWTNGLGVLVRGEGHVVRWNEVVWNGQMGFGVSCDGCRFEHNEASFNNWKGYDPYWEAGGGKWVGSRGTVIRDHLARQNDGPGIWLDIHNEGLVVERSVVDRNAVAGIMLEHETTGTVVRNNVVFGTRWYGWSGTGLLSQAASRNVIVHNTFVANEGTGLWIRRDPEGRAEDGHNVIYNNLFVANATVDGEEAREIQIEGDDLAHARTNRLDGNLYWPHESNWRRSVFYFAPDPPADFRGADLGRWRSLTQGEAHARLLDPGRPLLEDAASPEGWRLAPGSQAADRAAPLPADVASVLDDLDGEVRDAYADVGADERGAATPAEPDVPPPAFRLEPNYPNPFNPATTIVYTLDAPAAVRLRVVDVLGREVARLVDGEAPAGRHAVRFDAAGLPSGFYFCELEAGGRRERRAMVLLR